MAVKDTPRDFQSLPLKLRFSSCTRRPEEEAVSDDRDERQSLQICSHYKFSNCSSVTGKENTNVPHDVIEK